jgi:hypothetical protein
MLSDPFDQTEQAMHHGGIDAVLAQLVQHFQFAKKYHELFEVRKMQVRKRLGLPLVQDGSDEQLDPSERQQFEDGLIDACREVGFLLLGEGRIREGWTYLRPVGDVVAVAKELSSIEATPENVDELVQVLLSEGVEPARGYALVLKHYGTCNAITTFESQMYGMSRAVQQQAAAMLLENVHGELLENVKAHIGRQEGAEPSQSRLAELLASRPWLTSEGNYHIDASHLASTVRICRILESTALIERALDLACYGSRLHSTLQYPGEEPFVELYPAHERFYGALLGQNVDEALAHFHQRACQVDPMEYGTVPAEIYIQLLARLGRWKEAIRAWIGLIPEGARTRGLAPSLLSLCQNAGDYQPLLGWCRQRDDLLGYATGLMHARHMRPSPSTST